MTDPLRTLVLEDSQEDCELLLAELRRGGFEPSFERVQTAEEFLIAIMHGPWDVVLSDYVMPAFSAIEALKILQEKSIDWPLIVVSGKIGETVAVDAMIAGAHDYVMKDNLSRLVPAIRRELRSCAERKEHRRMEETLRHAQKMESVGRLAGGIAHDFNNVLTIVTGYSELLMKQYKPDDPLRKDLVEICKSVEQASTLTRQLLAFSRRQPIKPRVVSLNKLITETQKMLRRLIAENIELVMRLGPDVTCIKADPGQIEQILMNLVVNARDAMPGGGHLTVITTSLSADASFARGHGLNAPGPYFRLSVIDTGTGMNSETLEHVFEPFYTTKPEGKGTGLGLATVYGIVRQNGGNVEVMSDQGKGTTFHIYLPATEDQEFAVVPDAAPALTTKRSGDTILVVEDENVIRTLAQRILTQQGYRVLVAGNGEEALQLAQKHAGAIDLILTDMVMPQMGGMALAERCLSLWPETRVLAMSGYSEAIAADQGLRLNGTAFLQKPFTPHDLLMKVHELLDHRKAA